MTLRLGDTAHDFESDTSAGRIRFHDRIGDSWSILFSHPKDYTPICTTELGYMARIEPEFDKRNVEILGVSVDAIEAHRDWIKDIEETQDASVSYPIVADPGRKVANLYGMMHPAHDEVYTVRTVFVIDPKKKVRITITYPQTCGRNFNEILRVVDSLQMTDRFSVGAPVNWTKGQDVIIIPSVNDEDAKKTFPEGWKTLKPFLRITPSFDA